MGVIWQSELTERQKTVWWLLLATPSSLSHHTTPLYWKLRMTNPLNCINTVPLQTCNSTLSQSSHNIFSTVIRLQAAWFGVQIPAGAKHLSLLHSPPSSYWMGTTGYFPGVPQPGNETDTQLHLWPRFRISGVITPLPLYVFMVCIGTTLPLPPPSWHQMSLANSHKGNSHPILKVLCCQHITYIKYKRYLFVMCDW
jgi:hypothetical protein